MARACPCCDEEMDEAAAECAVCGYVVESEAPAAAPAPDASIGPGAVIDKKYRLIRRLGEGGMGEVWRAEHTLLKKDYALKLLGAEYCADSRFREKFLGEGRVLTQLRHKMIVEAHDVGITEASRLYLSMELVEGETLRDLIKRVKLFAVADALWIARELLAALIYAHDKGVVHRDLKPENLVVQGWGTDQRRLKILDFGIAKMIAEGMSTGTTANTMAGWGTIQYMSPEQMIGDPVDARTDIYAVGVILYEMLAGRRPLEAESGQKLAAKLLSEEAEPLRRVRPDVPPAVEAVVSAALSKQRERRPESAGRMLGALDVKLESAPARAKRWPIFVGVAIVAAVAAAIFVPDREQPVPPPPAPVVVEPAPPVADLDPPVTGATATEFSIEQGPAFCVALSPDGRTLACGLDVGKIALWTDGQARVIAGGAHFIQCIAFSPDGRLLAAGGGDGALRIWEAPFDARPRELAGHDHVVKSVVFSPDGTLLASAGADSTIRLWDVASGERTATLENTGGFVETVAFSPDGAMLASGTPDARVRLWSVRPPELLHAFAGHAAPVRGVAFAEWIVSVGDDATLRVWDAKSRAAVRSVELSAPASAVAMSPKSRHVAVAAGDRVVVYSTQSWDPVQEWTAAAPVHSVAWAAGGGRVAACGDQLAAVWELER